jgi:uncharacterized protein with HEPN domain
MSLGPAERDLDRVRDMIEHASQALEFVDGLDEQGFHGSRLHQQAVIRAVSIVGEAAYRMSPGFRAAQPDIPWPDIIRMRHKLMHDYLGISLTVVWATVRDDLPGLLARLRTILAP